MTTYREELAQFKAKRDGMVDATKVPSRKKKQEGDWLVKYAWGLAKRKSGLNMYLRFRAPTKEKALEYLTRIARKDNCHIAERYEDALAYVTARKSVEGFIFCRVMWLERVSHE